MMAVMTVVTNWMILGLRNRSRANTDHESEEEECLLHGAIVAPSVRTR